MSYERAESFIEDTDATASTVESEFDNIADYFQGLFQAGRMQASAKPTIGVGYTTIAGTEKTLVCARPSLLLAIATFDVDVAATDLFTGTLTIDGVASTQEATVAPWSGSNGWRGVLTQNFYKALGTGSHDLKLQCKRNGTSPQIFDIENTGYTYLLIPEP